MIQSDLWFHQGDRYHLKGITKMTETTSGGARILIKECQNIKKLNGVEVKECKYIIYIYT